MAITTREGLKEYCLRNLGAPVIEINVDPDQVEDRIDEALQFFQEYHSEATVRTYVKHQVTSTDVSNEYIELPSSDIFVVRMLPLSTGYGNSSGMFSFEYQFHLNDMAMLHSFMGDLSYYEQMKQYLSIIDMEFNGTPQVTFSRYQNRLYIHGDFADNDIKAGDWIILEVYRVVDPSSHGSIYDNMFLKEYTTALIKRQWGRNMSKFDGVQLPGGVTISGDKLFQEATEEIANLRERIRLENELPVDFYVG